MMTKSRVLVRRTIEEWCMVEVEAESRDAAVDSALEEAYQLPDDEWQWSDTNYEADEPEENEPEEIEEETTV